MKPASDKPRRRFLKQSAALVSSMAGMAASTCAPSSEAPSSVSSASSREIERTTLEALGRIVLPKRVLGDEGVSSVLNGFADWLSGFEAVAERDHPYLWTDEITYGPPDPAPHWRSQLEALELEAKKRYGKQLPRAELRSATGYSPAPSTERCRTRSPRRGCGTACRHWHPGVFLPHVESQRPRLWGRHREADVPGPRHRSR